MIVSAQPPTETRTRYHRYDTPARYGACVPHLRIESLAYGGDAVAHLEDGRAAFVRGACPGDLVDAEITENHDRFVRASVVNIIEASPDRVEPPCPYFGVCGGCSWQHISAEAQLVAKRQAVVDALTRIGRIEDAESLVAPTIASARQYGYRNKIELVARVDAIAEIPNSLRQGTAVRLSEARVHGSDPVGTGAGG